MSYEQEEQTLRQLTHDALTDEELFSRDGDSETDLELVSNRESPAEQDCEEEGRSLLLGDG
jgi:hypothetical protein